jgi:hypothetical protein
MMFYTSRKHPIADCPLLPLSFDVRWPDTISARLNLMEYCGVRYTIRAGIERGQWFVVIHPEGGDVPANKTYGSRQDAEVQAQRMINKWLDAKSRQRT